ncbi:MAG: hypothetical protein Q9218_008119 [Villophora microphyllina]
MQTVSNFKSLASSVENIYLVEASQSLRITQKNLLCGEDKAFEEVPAGYRSYSKHAGLPITWCEDIRFNPTRLPSSSPTNSLTPSPSTPSNPSRHPHLPLPRILSRRPQVPSPSTVPRPQHQSRNGANSSLRLLPPLPSPNLQPPPHPHLNKNHQKTST